MALYALLTAVCVVGRLLTSLIPNVQPITAILLIVTLNIGVLPALLIGALSIVITNLYLGMGIWTIAQIFSFAIIILLMGALKKWTPLKSFLLGEVVVSFLLSLLYGLLV